MTIRLTNAESRKLLKRASRKSFAKTGRAVKQLAVGAEEWLKVKRAPPGSREFTVPGPPVPKPRQTHSDRWRARPVVQRYRGWADLVRAIAPADISEASVTMRGVVLSVTFYLPTPKSWSAEKRAAMQGTRHLNTPDIDNCLKAVCDALWPCAGETNDSVVWKYRECEKLWDDGKGPRTEVRWSTE